MYPSYAYDSHVISKKMIVPRRPPLAVVMELVSLGTILTLFCLFTGADGQACTQDVVTWVGINETLYDRSFSSIDDPNGRPLGFERTVIPYSDLGLPNPCIRVENIEDTRVEVMAESNPPGSIFCVRDQYNREICEDRIYDCRQADAQGDNSITFEFHCDATSCDESDVRIFYRFAVSPPGDVLDPELWCFGRDTGEYPSSLNAPLPTNRDLATLPPDGTGGAVPSARWTASLGLVLLSSVLCLASSVVMSM